MNKSKLLFRGLWSLSFLLSSIATFGIADAAIPGYPDQVTAYDPREVGMLPRYCIHTQSFRASVPGGGNPAEIKRWTAVMGPMLENMHHYCWGLMKTNRATILARNKQDRLFYLSDAIGEFNYVIERAPADFVLLPEILTRKGENLLRLGKSAQGLAELQRAIDLKPDYWPPYESIAEYYKAVGDIAKAREVLEKALSFSPESTSLKSRLSELGAAPDKRKPTQ
ncbi:MAG: hypothetical protein ABI831_00815 [Betaproteobacteria bacterium]